MGNACCSDNTKGTDKVARLFKEAKPLKVTVTGQEPTPQNFGRQLNENYFKVGEKAKALVRDQGLYKFEQSGADLRGSESNPVKQGVNEDYKYEGQMLGNKMHGKGHLLTAGGDLYVSPFFEDYAQGHGWVYFHNGNFFVGRLLKGDLDSGKMVYANGTTYVGEFKNGKRNGKGSLVYADGSKYEGGWLDDQEHGAGKLIQEGIWDKGRKVEAKKATVEGSPSGQLSKEVKDLKADPLQPIVKVDTKVETKVEAKTDANVKTAQMPSPIGRKA